MTPRNPFFQLVEMLRDGEKLPMSSIEWALGDRTFEDLVREAFSSESEAPMPGEPCECGGKARVRTSKTSEDNFRISYLACNRCNRNLGRRVSELSPDNLS